MTAFGCCCCKSATVFLDTFVEENDEQAKLRRASAHSPAVHALRMCIELRREGCRRNLRPNAHGQAAVVLVETAGLGLGGNASENAYHW